MVTTDATDSLQAGQFYSGFWAAQPDGRRLPEDNDIRIMLGDICANSDAEISFQRLSFTIDGSDDAVKAALHVISQIRFVTQSQYTIRVKIELANEHKEFVSGKKNGKINKIMGQSKHFDLLHTDINCLDQGNENEY